jgi:cytochrome c oxidase assembly protein subunit 15
MKSTERPRALANWLFAIAFLVFVMVVIGGITRLTESGLSITEWKPLSGAIPPLNVVDWQAEFARYQATPEYQQVNGPAGMDLPAFQKIYFWEWLHRLLGRLIGLAFALPLIWFVLRRAIPRGYGWRLIALLALGGFQGALGWYMVQSGLVNRIDVSHFRLAAHLLTAFLLLGGLIWTALDLRQHPRSPAHLNRFSMLVLVTLTIQLLLGAWVAGLNAGQVANTWPLMNDRLVPDGIDWSNGLGFALTHDPYLIHFLHRWWAFVTLVVLVLFVRGIRPRDRRAALAIDVALGVQIFLGIATVISGVTLWLAVLHQAVGALLVAATAWGAHAVGSRSQ